ncbi:MAG: efflux RND transporter periplasmic adaptor subunit [Janthinobacterium lividum]
MLLLVLCLLAGCSKQGRDSAGGSAGDSKSGGSASATQDKPDSSAKGGAQANDVVKIPVADQQRAGIQTAYVSVQRMPRTLVVAGQVEMDEQHTSHLGTVADGRIVAVNVLPGAPVHRGQVLGSLHGHMVHETVGALVQAYAAATRQRGALAFARQAQERYHHLYSIQAASLEESQRSDQEVQQAQQLLVDAEANVRMEREHLSELLQVSPESLNANNLYDRELIPIRSPIDGVVITRNISVGQVVTTGFVAFDLSNLSTVWVTGAVNQQDLSLMHQGAAADVVTAGYPDQVFHGRVAMVGDMLDPTTRTVPVRIVVPNPGVKLRPGMFASAHIAEPSTRDAVFVPEDALQNINGMPVVFVTRDGSTFQARTVNVGTHSMGRAEIVEGLQPGDHIVVNGAFMVKSEMLKGTMGDG